MASTNVSHRGTDFGIAAENVQSQVTDSSTSAIGRLSHDASTQPVPDLQSSSLETGFAEESTLHNGS